VRQRGEGRSATLLKPQFVGDLKIDAFPRPTCIRSLLLSFLLFSATETCPPAPAAGLSAVDPRMSSAPAPAGPDPEPDLLRNPALGGDRIRLRAPDFVVVGCGRAYGLLGLSTLAPDRVPPPRFTPDCSTGLRKTRALTALTREIVAPSSWPASPGYAGAPCGPRLWLGFRPLRAARFCGCQGRSCAGRDVRPGRRCLVDGFLDRLISRFPGLRTVLRNHAPQHFFAATRVELFLNPDCSPLPGTAKIRAHISTTGAT
jgi:hypothetical protein